MKNIFQIVFAVFMLFQLAACSSGGAGNGGAKGSSSDAGLLGPQDFQNKLNELNDEILIDLRTHAELHQIGPLAGASNLDFNAGRFERVLPQLNKQQPIMLYCASGGRSGEAAKMLKEQGFTKVYDLDGGVQAWKSAGLPVRAHSH